MKTTAKSKALKSAGQEFNERLYKKTGEVSVHKNDLEKYKHLGASKMVSGKHKTLGNYITLKK